MTANPLQDFAGRPRAGKVTLEQLEELSASLNRANFVRDTGKPYFVGRRFDGDRFIHFLDRRP